MLSKNLESIISQLEELTRSLFPEILKIYQNPRSSAQEKKDGSPVTAADMYAHKVIVNFLKRHFSEIPIVSEESFRQKNYRPAKEFWIIDPIDGTKEFVNKSNEFTTNIALIQNGKPALGVVGAPAFDQVWSGIAIEPMNNVKTQNKARSILRIVTSKSHRTLIDTAFLNFLDKKGKKLKIISKGSSLKICALVDEKADIYPRFGPTSEWDIAAADAVLKSYGGSIFSLEDLEKLKYSKKNILNPPFIAYRNELIREAYSQKVEDYVKKLV